MALPSETDLASLDIAYLGQPFVQVEAKSLDSESLDIAYLGQPFVAVGPGAAPPAGFNVWANVSGVWKQASAVFVNVSGTWKTATTVSVNVAATWKS
jgi:hypothetical protein